MSQPGGTENSFTGRWHVFLEMLLPRTQHWTFSAYVFLSFWLVIGRKCQECLWNCKTYRSNSPKLRSWNLKSRARAYLYTWEELFIRKLMDLDPCIGILIVQKGQERSFKFDISHYSNSHFSITIGLISSTKIICDNFLSAETSSNKNLIFAQSMTRMSGSKLLLLFSRFSNSYFAKTLLRYNTACPSSL